MCRTDFYVRMYSFLQYAKKEKNEKGRDIIVKCLFERCYPFCFCLQSCYFWKLMLK